MKFMKLAGMNQDEILSVSERILRLGGVVICPTDTVYGILGNAADERAIRTIFELKKRPQEKALPIFVKDIETARRYAYISDAKARLLARVWPGPVTAVFNHKEKLPARLTGGHATIGIRMPDYDFLLDLLGRCGFPLVQTSANISDKPPGKDKEEIAGYFDTGEIQPDLCIDAGPIVTIPSTVIDCTGDRPFISRLGAMSKDELDRIIRGAA